MTTLTIFASVLFMGFTCSMGCGTVNTPFLLGSLLGDGASISDSRRAIALFSLGKVTSLMIMGVLSSIFGGIVLAYVESLYPNATIWIIRIVTFLLGIKILYTTVQNDFIKKSDCGGCSGCPKSSAKPTKLPKSYLFAGLLYATIPCGPLLTTLTYASTMNVFVAVLLLALFGIVNSLIPVFFFASLVGLANSEFNKNSAQFLKFIKLSGGIILIYASIFKVY